MITMITTPRKLERRENARTVLRIPDIAVRVVSGAWRRNPDNPEPTDSEKLFADLRGVWLNGGALTIVVNENTYVINSSTGAEPRRDQ